MDGLDLVAIAFALLFLVGVWLPEGKLTKRREVALLALLVVLSAVGVWQGGTFLDLLWPGTVRVLAGVPLYGVLALLLWRIPLAILRRHRRPLDVEDLKRGGWIKHTLWGLLQQTLLLAFLLPAVGPVYAAAIFAAIHFPNPLLTLVTFAGGLASCWIAQDVGAASLLVAGLSHSVTSALLDGTLDDFATGKMRIGIDWLNWKRSLE